MTNALVLRVGVNLLLTFTGHGDLADILDAFASLIVSDDGKWTIPG